MKLLPLFIALFLSAAPGWAQGPREAGLWPVTAAGPNCTISQSFADPEFGPRTLEITYDATREEVAVIAIGAAPASLPETGRVAWSIVFLGNGDVEHDDAWGARQFTYARDGEAHRFATRFAGRGNVRQILADLAASRGVGFLQDGELVTAFDLGGIGGSIERLRPCAAARTAQG